jgi:hypothetical protein
VEGGGGGGAKGEAGTLVDAESGGAVEVQERKQVRAGSPNPACSGSTGADRTVRKMRVKLPYLAGGNLVNNDDP